ncbi:4Fe-4S ferredoxin [Desulfosporosinus sp. OT]|uniref:4Fe-4S ferredoxin n=1 Tax=Desulfosporosinus sp. OT TaxID=913865 RepID=UPI000223AE8B|nr:4Fe-4S ferredoxin [Desulfosporosinus sp. OT]EGW41712.1 4Fe-4S ferredoxin iron-sulfur binding domain protein [Desulfosporosinus sp. OT]
MEKASDLQQHLSKISLDYGALVVGYTKIRQVEPVMVIGFPFSNKWILNHPFYITKRFGEEVWHSWKLLRNIAHVLHKEGYLTDIKTPLSVFGDFRPLAVSAGLGNWGKNGLVVNPQYGSKLIFASIFTNAPLETDVYQSASDDVNHACANCRQCINACPAMAFEGNKFHKVRCFPKAIRGCSECVQVCKGQNKLPQVAK